MSFGRFSVLLAGAVLMSSLLPACVAGADADEGEETDALQVELIETDQSGPRTTEPGGGDASTRACKKDCGSRWLSCMNSCERSHHQWWCENQCNCYVLEGRGWATCERENTIIDL